MSRRLRARTRANGGGSDGQSRTAGSGRGRAGRADHRPRVGAKDRRAARGAPLGRALRSLFRPPPQGSAGLVLRRAGRAADARIGNPNPLKLIIFDVDGTLVDSQNLLVAAQRETFLKHGLTPPSRERSLSIVGLSLVKAFEVLAGPEGPAESLAEGYRQAFQRLRAEAAYEEPLFPGAAELLLELAARNDAVLGIATGKSRRGVAHLLERHGWERIFATIQTADDAPSKPDPGMI